MKFRLARTALACLATILATAPALAREPAEINVFAWEVRPPAAKPDAVPDLLVGTMHVAITPGKRLPDALTRRFVHASRFAMEADVTNIPPGLIARYVTIPASEKGLQQQLPAPSWAKLVTLAKAHGLPAERVTRMAPWVVSMAFLDLDSPGGALMDSQLRNEAEHGKIPVSFLETAEDQFQALTAVSQRENISQLVEVLDDPTKPKRELAELETAYGAGNLKKVQDLMFGADRIEAYPDFYRKVFWERNANWVPKVKGMFAPGGAVVAVGLGHMLGDRGLIALLTKAGYHIAPLTL